MPCVDIVTEVADIVGVWRRYYAGATDMAYTEFRTDGTLSIVQSLPGDARVSATITFEDGVAAFSANPDGPAPAECKVPGRYELRLIRVGSRPVALTYGLVGEDDCLLRVNDFSMPMIAYTGSGEALMSVDAPGVPPMCQRATQRFHLYRYGTQNVALLLAAIEDACLPKLQDTRLPIIWVAGAV